jgi:DtxR family transcriptional regulator, Mn-dependent transcriptional regulator
MHVLSEMEEEILESLWIQIKEHKKHPDLKILKDQPALASLIEKKLIDLNSEQLLTAAGWQEAQLCVRRHRLAERLLADLFDVKDPLLHEAGCKFEHGLHHGLEDNVCTLLGHPRCCPHGKMIPRGNCCQRATVEPKRFIISLKELSPGDSGKISYINTHDKEVLNKLIAMGILPGNQVKLLHRFPSYVFEMDNASFAVDGELAENIHVLLLSKKG